MSKRKWMWLYLSILVVLAGVLAITNGCGLFPPSNAIVGPHNESAVRHDSYTGWHDRTRTTQIEIGGVPSTSTAPAAMPMGPKEPTCPLPPPPPPPPPPDSMTAGKQQSEGWGDALMHFVESLLPGTPCYADAPPAPKGYDATKYEWANIDGHLVWAPKGATIKVFMQNRDIAGPSTVNNDREVDTSGSGWHGTGAPPADFKPGEAGPANAGDDPGAPGQDPTKGPSAGASQGGEYKGPVAAVVGGPGLMWVIIFGGLVMVAGILIAALFKDYLAGGIVAAGGALMVVLGCVAPQIGGIVVIVGLVAGLGFLVWYIWTHKQQIADAISSGEAMLGHVVLNVDNGLKAVPSAVATAIKSVPTSTPLSEASIAAAATAALQTVKAAIGQNMDSTAKTAVAQAKVDNPSVPPAPTT